jgi:hypothetical protein
MVIGWAPDRVRYPYLLVFLVLLEMINYVPTPNHAYVVKW